MTKKLRFEMAMSNIWFLMFGFSIGVTSIVPAFWWMPVFIIVCLIVARVLIKLNDRKVKSSERKRVN